MKSLGEVEAIGTHFKLSDWEQEEDPCSLWTSPSSPPYSEPHSRIDRSLSANRRSSADRSPPSTSSEFEFDSLAMPEIRDEPPVSPKFLSSAAYTGYWAAMASASQEDSSACTSISSLHSDMVSPIDRPRDAPSGIADAPLSHSKKQPSTPPSPSVRQLITEEMHGGEHDEADLNFYSAPQTPAPRSRPLTPKHGPLSLDYEPSADLDKHLGSHDLALMMAQRKSRSAVLDRPNVALYPELTTTAMKGLTPSRSQPHPSFIDSTSTSSLNAWDKSEEEKDYNGAPKKAGSSKGSKKWAFKDLLRRTVPSSKADAHYITKTLEATSSSRSLFSHSRSTPISPQASPLRSYIDSTSRQPTLQARRPYSRMPRSPPHLPPSTHARSPAHSALDTHSDANKSQYSSTSSRTPAPSPPRSPLSPHVAHYKLQKAQSQELGRKTFLPYRRSLLGCLGGSGAFSSDQLVW